jgi:hypothetical protein
MTTNQGGGRDDRDPRYTNQGRGRDERDPRDDDDDDEGELIPQGRYVVRAIHCRFGHADNEKRTEQVGLQLEIQEGEFKGRLLSWYGFFTDDATEIALKAMRALGWEGVDLRQFQTVYNGKAQAVVQHERDPKGKMRAKVQWINPIGVAMKNEYGAVQLAQLAQRIKGTAARIGMPGSGGAGGGDDRRPPTAPPRAPAGAQRDPWDDDRPPPPSDDDAPRGGGRTRW